MTEQAKTRYRKYRHFLVVRDVFLVTGILSEVLGLAIFFGLLVPFVKAADWGQTVLALTSYPVAAVLGTGFSEAEVQVRRADILRRRPKPPVDPVSRKRAQLDARKRKRAERAFLETIS